MLKPALPSYTIYSYSLPRYIPDILWVPRPATPRGSAIHVFLVNQNISKRRASFYEHGNDKMTARFSETWLVTLYLGLVCKHGQTACLRFGLIKKQVYVIWQYQKQEVASNVSFEHAQFNISDKQQFVRFQWAQRVDDAVDYSRLFGCSPIFSCPFELRRILKSMDGAD